MKLSVIHPTIRPAKAIENLLRWKERAINWQDVEYILIGGDTPEGRELAAAGDLARVELVPERPGYVHKLNRGGQLATGDVIIENHDDILPPEGWDLQIAAEMQGAGERVLRVSHGGDREKSLCVPMILSRGWYDRWRFVSHPALVHLYADDYFTWMATRFDVIREAPQIVFKHEHPYFMPEKQRRAAFDEIYARNYAAERWAEDGETFEWLKKAWEPPAPTETLQIHVPVANRHQLARECVALLRARSPANTQIIVWLDGPTAAHQKEGFDGANIVYVTPRIGIEKQRALHLRFWEKHRATWLYFTDGDAIHAADWFTPCRRLAIETGALVSGYRTWAHHHDVTEDCGSYLKHKYVAGVSMLMHEELAAHVVSLMPENGEIQCDMGGFDWAIPAMLQHRCVVPWQSVVDHVGIGGMHHGGEEVGSGDRAINPAGDLDARVRMLWPKALEGLEKP